jgi:hypothetical protein
MFIIKHSVERRDGTVIFDEVLPVGGESYPECTPHMEQLAKSFEHHGYDGQHDRWWGWNKETRTELHHWWTVPIAPANE